MEQLEKFLERREAEIYDECQGEAFLVVTVTPALVDQERIDVRDEELRRLVAEPPDDRRAGWNIASIGGRARYSLYGLQVDGGGGTFAELHRNGHLEIRVRIAESVQADSPFRDADGERRLMWPLPVVEWTVSAHRLARRIFKRSAITESVVVRVNLNVRGWALQAMPTSFPRRLECAIWNRGQHVEPSAIRVPRLDHPDSVARGLLDRLWQAFGFGNAPFFDANGNFVPPSS